MSNPRTQSSRILIALAALLALAILGAGCGGDGGELGGAGGIGGGNSNEPPGNPPPAGEPIPVLGNEATLSWSPASGPVFAYKVQVARNGGGFAEETDISGASVTLMGETGDVVQVRVAAFDADGNLGPMSPPSDRFVFVGNTSTASGGEGSGDGSGESGSGSGASGSVAGGSEGSGSTDEPPVEEPAETGSPFALAGDDLVWQSQDGAHLRVTSADLTRARLYTLPSGAGRVVAAADFDGDGTSDLLFASDGALSLASGSALEAAPGELALVPWADLPAGAEFAATGDFDADGLADAAVVAGTEVSLWLAAGDVLALPAVADEARLAGAGDADADGSADLLWRGGDGSLVLWHIVVGALAAESPVSLPEGAAFVAFADLDGNGAADLASQSAPDALGVSQAVAPFTGWVEAAPSGASLAGCGDYDGDGTRDRLWVDAGGLRVVGAAGEVRLTQEQLGAWSLLETCK